MHVELRWGKKTVSCRLPGAADVLEAKRIPVLSDPCAALERALAHPLGAPAFKRFLKGRDSACIVVSDATRKTGFREISRVLFQKIRAAGITPRRISVLVAYGDHRKMTAAEFREAVGEVPLGVRVIHHDSLDDGSLVPLGVLPSGKLLRVNKAAVQAGAVIVTGTVSFHYHAGYGGGRKAILPGIASHDDVLANHALILDDAGPGGRNRNCLPGRLRGNPVHRDMRAAARMLPRTFLINTLLDPSDRIARIFAGNMEKAFATATRTLKQYFTVGIRRTYEFVIASAGGYPKDATFYQAHKAFDHACRAVGDGGVVVFVAECCESSGGARRGSPDERLLEWSDIPDYGTHLASLKREFEVPGQTALALRWKLRRIRGILVSRMKPEDARRLGLLPAGNLDKAIEAAHELLGRRQKSVAVMPEAASVLPVGRPPP